MAKLQFSGPKQRNSPFLGVPCGKPMTCAKFHAISTQRPMIFTSTFLPCAMISGVSESLERPWRFVLHQNVYSRIPFFLFLREN